MGSYFIFKNGKQLGPYVLETIQEMKNSELIDSNVLYRKEGMQDWQNIESLLGSTQVQIPPLQTIPQNPLKKHSAVAKDFEYAGFLLRFGATCIDAIVVLGGWVIGFIIAFVMILGGVSEGLMMALTHLICYIVAWLYCAISESSVNQATWGKMACGLKVVSVEGERISFGRASGRFFAKFLSYMILCIGYLMCVFTKKKQCLHDMICECLVVKK
jgi:uncharacterized RDD family membrane protein YckC